MLQRSVQCVCFSTSSSTHAQAKQQLFMEAAGSASTSTSGGAAAAGAGAARGALVAPTAVPLLEGGEGEEASLQAPAPAKEVAAGADLRYLFSAVLK